MKDAKDWNIVAQRYSATLHDLLETAAQAEEAYTSLTSILQTLDNTEGYKALALNPRVPIVTRKKIWEVLMDAADVSDLIRSFLSVVLQNNRIHLLSKILAAFKVQLLKRLGVKEVNMESSVELTAAQLKKVAAELKAIFDMPVELNMTVDQGLIGGAVLKFDTYMLDRSIKTQLSNMKAKLLS